MQGIGPHEAIFESAAMLQLSFILFPLFDFAAMAALPVVLMALENPDYCTDSHSIEDDKKIFQSRYCNCVCGEHISIPLQKLLDALFSKFFLMFQEQNEARVLYSFCFFELHFATC